MYVKEICVFGYVCVYMHIYMHICEYIHVEITGRDFLRGFIVFLCSLEMELLVI